MVRPSHLDDPETARHAWARYRRLLRWMGLLAVVSMVVAVTALIVTAEGEITIHMMIAMAAGTGLSVMLMAALMGLVFLSSGTGHDDSIVDPTSEEWDDTKP